MNNFLLSALSTVCYSW